MKLRKIGVLGGMGPAATVDFIGKVIAATPAARDQDHVPLLVHAVPQIPDRTEALGRGEDGPFPPLLDGLRTLQQAGAELIVIPCNTAHAWFDRLAALSEVPLLHIAQAVRREIDQASRGNGDAIALMATPGTVRAGFYQRWLPTATRSVEAPRAEIQAEITGSIAAIKAGDVATGRELAAAAGKRLLDEGATGLLLACTELPIALEGAGLEARCIDATASLAHACVAFSRGEEMR